MNANKRRTNPIRRAVFASAVLFTATAGLPAHAACDLRITSAYPWLPFGDGTNHVGGNYGLRVNMTVTGTPTQPFRIKFTIANTTRW